MKEKISNEKRTMIQTRNRDRAQVATLLRCFLEKFRYSQVCVECTTESPFFNDSCNFVGLHHELTRMAETLENMVEYENQLLQDFYE